MRGTAESGVMSTSSVQGGGFPDSSAGKESIHLQCRRAQFPGLERSAAEGIGYLSSILGLPWWLRW